MRLGRREMGTALWGRGKAALNIWGEKESGHAPALCHSLMPLATFLKGIFYY